MEINIPNLPEIDQPRIEGTFNIVVTGVGGTGVVTVGASWLWHPILRVKVWE